MLYGLVPGKARRVSRDFKQHASGFAEINGMKILAVNNWGDVVFEFRQFTPPTLLLLVGCGSPSHVMDGSYGNSSESCFRSANQVDHRTGHSVRDGIAEAVPLFCDLPKSQSLNQQ